MVSAVPVLTRKITRNKLAEFLDNHELIKAFENLTQDVGTTLPDAIGTNTDAIAESQATADTALAASVAARAIADYVGALVEALMQGPPPTLPRDDVDERILAILPPFPTKLELGLGNVENTALSTWPGSTNLTTLGTITTGVWNGTIVQPLYGGTGISAYSVGDMLYANGATSLARLASTATGNVLRASGVGSPPAWGQVALTTDVNGILPVANGGTGVTALSSLVANPSASTGLTAVNGSASTFMRSDAAPALSQTISPTWTGNHTFAPASGSTLISSGHLGIGVTPSTWSAGRAVEVGAAGNAIWAYGTTTYLTQGVNYNSGFKYATAANPVNAFGAQNGAFYWYTAPAGTVGNAVPFTTAMLLDANGNLGVALTPSGSYKVEIGGALSVSSTTMIRTATAFSNGAAASGGTLTNAPAAGNPTKWVPINDAGITRYIPAW